MPSFLRIAAAVVLAILSAGWVWPAYASGYAYDE